MENVLFKISFPAEFHAQTAVEAAMTLHPQLAATGSAQTSSASSIETQEAAMRIIDKPGRSPIPPTAITASSTWWPCR